MITLERLKKATDKIENIIRGIPLDELVPENPDYVKWEKLLKGLKAYTESYTKFDRMLTELGV